MYSRPVIVKSRVWCLAVYSFERVEQPLGMGLVELRCPHESTVINA
jgi:hypothetical protein